MSHRSYRKLIQLPTFEERYKYLRMGGQLGISTFGFDRYLNQRFYSSREWKRIRNEVIVRDNACDLAMPGYEIGGVIHIHHLNPISIKDIEQGSDILFGLDNLVSTSLATHNAIHYGSIQSLVQLPKERKKGDTKLW
jgi:hypothetical protein